MYIGKNAPFQPIPSLSLCCFTWLIQVDSQQHPCRWLTTTCHSSSTRIWSLGPPRAPALITQSRLKVERNLTKSQQVSTQFYSIFTQYSELYVTSISVPGFLRGEWGCVQRSIIGPKVTKYKCRGWTSLLPHTIPVVRLERQLWWHGKEGMGGENRPRALCCGRWKTSGATEAQMCFQKASRQRQHIQFRLLRAREHIPKKVNPMVCLQNQSTLNQLSSSYRWTKAIRLTPASVCYLLPSPQKILK